MVAIMLVGGAYCEYLAAAPTPSPQDLIEKTSLVVSLYKDPADPDNHNYGGVCSGVWIGSNHILTANHCVYEERSFDSTNQKDVEVSTFLNVIRYDTPEHHKQPSMAGKLVKVNFNRECDVAVLRTKEPATLHPIAELSLKSLTVGQQVQTVGHPGELAWVYMRGFVSVADSDYLKDPTYNVININIGHGNSGGGLFNDDNKLVGITRAIVISGDAKLAIYANQECLADIISSAKSIERKDSRVW